MQELIAWLARRALSLTRVFDYVGYKQAYEKAVGELGPLRLRAPSPRTDEEAAPWSGSPSVILASLPNSGARYIIPKFERLLGYNERSLCVGEFPKYVVSSLMARDFARGGLVNNGCLQCDAFNMKRLREHGLTRIALYVCDPRLTTFNRMRSPPSRPDLLAQMLPSPQVFLARSHAEQLDYFIDNFLSDCIQWLNAWANLLDTGDIGFRVWVCRREELIADENAFIKSILDIYGLSDTQAEGMTDAIIGGGRADDEERGVITGAGEAWRGAIPADQFKRMTEMIPDRLFERFGWVR